MYRYYNSEEWFRLSHSIYIKANMISVENNYIEAEVVAKWYERNLKIFSNIQRLAAKNERKSNQRHNHFHFHGKYTQEDHQYADISLSSSVRAEKFWLQIRFFRAERPRFLPI